MTHFFLVVQPLSLRLHCSDLYEDLRKVHGFYISSIPRISRKGGFICKVKNSLISMTLPHHIIVVCFPNHDYVSQLLERRSDGAEHAGA